MKKVYKTYYGGKESAGVPQTLINVIPPHNIFCELFGGNYTLSRYINTPVKLINDIEPSVFKMYPATNNEFRFYNLDFWELILMILYDEGVFLYCDPPYIMDTRTCKKKTYKSEMEKVAQHKDFLNKMLSVSDRFKIAISHYKHPLYESLLKLGWYAFDYESQTRSGRRKERLYMNYDPTSLTELQDYRYLGLDRIDRQRIKRRIRLLSEKLEALPPLERQAVIQSIKQKF